MAETTCLNQVTRRSTRYSSQPARGIRQRSPAGCVLFVIMTCCDCTNPASIAEIRE